MEENQIKPIQTYAVVELMGHVKTAGMVSEETHFGTVLLRLDIPATDGKSAHTEFYGGSSIYRITPCDEQVARMVLAQTCQVPIVHFQLPKPQFGQSQMFVEIEEDDDEQDG